MRTIAIIGAGFSGTAIAVNLLCHPSSEPRRVILINRSGEMARGVAYGTRSPEHMLNVPAGNMSALPDDPDHFVKFCRTIDSTITAASFIPRSTYGQYLAWLLSGAERKPGRHASLQRMVGEVIAADVGTAARGATISLADGTRLSVGQIVLAFGHFPPKDPVTTDARFHSSTWYIRDPWAPATVARIRNSRRVLLLGTGLTSIDVCISLLNASHDRLIYAVSRRGLLPCNHRPSGPQPRALDISTMMQRVPATIRQYVHAVRNEVREYAQAGGDWRDVLTAIRRMTPALWMRLPVAERARFLRHVQPYWEVHRHRCAPVPYSQFQELIASGVVRVMAGRIVDLQEHDGDVVATLRARGARALSQLAVDVVVNCTGPDTDLTRVDDPLVKQLLSIGQVRPDPLRLGIQTSSNYAVLDARARPSRVLYYLGPLLRASHWEATAVPELRVHAQLLANQLLSEPEPGSDQSMSHPNTA